VAKGEDIRWGVAQRFEFIEWRVYWEGRLNRGDLELEFSISTPQASVDLRNYQSLAPGNIEYDGALRAYVRTADFRPQFLRLSGRKYLEQLRGIEEGYVAIADTWFSDAPPVALLPQLHRVPNDYILQAVIAAIRENSSISINYMSLTKTAVRQVAPHAIAYDGARWHTRAWCFKNEEFRDFVLGRILSIGNSDESAKGLPEDVGWSNFVNLTIAPHPALEDYQQDAVERDYMMEDRKKTLTMRACLAYYFVRRNNLDLPDISPVRSQIVLTNYDHYKKSMSDLGLTP
jgi:hypothetical protein